MSDEIDIPLFPLRTVLFPNGPLPLRIFETRYLDMIGRCMREGGGFAVVLMSRGSESGPARFCRIGTVAEIVDWYQGSDGLLGLTARGRERVEILRSDVAADGLNIGRARIMSPLVNEALPPAYEFLADILKSVLDDFGRLYAPEERHYDDAHWVSCRLAEILPIRPEEKQLCLETDDATERLEIVARLVRAARDSAT